MPPVLSRSRQLFCLLATSSVALSACGGDKPKDQAAGGAAAPAQASGVALTGAGATFPNPIYTKWFDTYAKATGVRINYQSIGSGGGIRQFTEGTVDFGATDGPMSTEQMGAVKNDVLHVPTVLGADVLTYNLPAIGSSKLVLDGDAIAGIFLGRITKWNDPKLVALNSGLKLPNTDIIVVHRSDGSGTTSNFTKYLHAAAKDVWKLGSGDTVKWPTDTQGGEKNTGVATLIKNGDGTIGYVDLSDAKASGLKFASIKNKEGRFVAPTLDGAKAALAGATVKDDVSYDPLNAAGADSYPITSPTYLIVRTKYDDAKKAEAVKGFITYLLGDGTKLAEEVNFAPLPDTLKTRALAQLDKITS